MIKHLIAKQKTYKRNFTNSERALLKNLNEEKNALLFLEDGSIFYGWSFGYPCETSGEVVFNTGMVGYPESLTDPSYHGQILVQTYPLIGNYGIPKTLTDSFGIPIHFESERIQVNGYIVSEFSKRPSHWCYQKTLNQWLIEQKIPGLYGIDTRELTKKLRARGVMLGILKTYEKDENVDIDGLKEEFKKIENPNDKNLVEDVSTNKPIFYENENSPSVVVIDCGVKFGILRCLLQKNLNIIRVPFNYSIEKILDFNPKGIVISNGPGNPKKCIQTINTLKELIETNIPILGICYGVQLLALAADADTYKLKFGHRGQNHPCIDLTTKRCYITSQNHGYAVSLESLEKTDFEVYFVNVNDKTVEGIKHKKKKIVGIQFHPEASPGPYETEFLFDKFVKDVKECQS
jgi:carbamoyl-phosphate synthase small subunit